MNINKVGSSFFNVGELDLLKKYPKGVFMLMYNSAKDLYYLDQLPEFKIPKKIYGNYDAFLEKVIKRFFNFNKSLGVHLCGEKGTGKTMLSQAIAQTTNLPTILINEYFEGTKFIKFLAEIEQECVVLFDEFEKHYRTEIEQNDILQILDSNYATKKLFILTSNTNRNSAYLNNRPSRIFYYKDFNQISNENIYEVLNDLLKNKDFIKDGIDTIQKYQVYNFDSIISLINESNFLNVPLSIAIQDMNLKPDPHMVYSIFSGDNQFIAKDSLATNYLDIKLKTKGLIDYFGDDVTESGYLEISSLKNLKSREEEGGKKVYTLESGKEIIFVPEYRVIDFLI